MAHFLAQEGSHQQEAIQLFQESLKKCPGHVLYMMWFAKALRQCKQFPQAELMYRVAIEKAEEPQSSFRALLPTALCNYATFLYKYRKSEDIAQNIFQSALER